MVFSILLQEIEVFGHLLQFPDVGGTIVRDQIIYLGFDFLRVDLLYVFRLLLNHLFWFGLCGVFRHKIIHLLYWRWFLYIWLVCIRIWLLNVWLDRIWLVCIWFFGICLRVRFLCIWLLTVLCLFFGIFGDGLFRLVWSRCFFIIIGRLYLLSFFAWGWLHASE